MSQIQQTQPIDWNKVKAVAFDVDGTLYTQSKMRKKMLFALLSYYLIRPWRIKELKMLRDFRSEREKRSGSVCEDLENAQYAWCAAKGNYSIPELKKIVEHWMFKFPNQYLRGCMYPGTKSFFASLKQKGYLIAIYSDYKATDKLEAMNLNADLVVSSTDPHIDRLKPDPKALHYIAGEFGLKPEECLFIGDRQELDGQCAINAGWQYLIVEKKSFETFDFYTNLERELPSKAPVNQTTTLQES
ncbi:HAD family hydrolase [Paradesertivirga mongoliensis]|uniref:phosphoglycolate phosphatase n=1 Tax=Paradesertivirga mongoliensis TaxID=2100740 RepID=A0ABW4ZIC8_9SPHI|nr:HAD family hydrolase [Pedobacter mongoliensis]